MNVTVTTPPCMVCGKRSELQMPAIVVDALAEGMFIQEAWAEATPDQRELYLTGTHPDCWEILCPPEEN